jgi:restriction endonuclease S subunit
MTTAKIPSPRKSRREEAQKLTDWRWVRLGDCVAKIGSGFTPLGGHAVYQPSGAPLIRSQNVHMNRFEPNGLAFISDEQSAEMESSQVLAGDVLLNITGASIGRVCVAPAKYCPANVNQHVCIIRGDGTLDSELLSFYFASHEFQKFIMSSQAGATRQALTKVMIENFRVPYAELKEQRRLAARLREQMAEVERARAAVQAQLDATQTLPTALLRDIFTSPAAQHWPVRHLGDLFETRNDIIHPRNRPTGSATFVGLEHIEPNTGRRIGSIEIDKTEMTGRKAQFFKGDIVYGYLRPYLNKVWIAEFDGLCSVDQYVYQVKSDLAATPFVAWFMRSSTYLERAPIGGSPGQLPRIRMDEVAATEINLPPLGEQQKIAARLDAELIAARALVERLETRLAEIELLPAALLRAVFSQQN